MKTIKFKNMDEVLYYKKLTNGMDFYLYNKEGVTNNYVTFTTKFGSIYNEFVPIGKSKMVKVPHGVAHFLEHKVFAQEKGPQPEEFFAQSGAICNAYTTFKNTTYLFSGPTNLVDNINFLLDYVQNPYFTDDNVSSEKGIITQEIHMCDDNPSDVMYEHIRKNVFHNNPFKDSIIGTVKDITSISVDTLFTCYNTFYHPSNMFLVVTGNFDSNEVMAAIEENQQDKEFRNSQEKIEVRDYKERDSVVKKKEIIEVNTKISKVSYNIKVPQKDIEMSRRKYNLYLFVIFSIMFDDSSLFDEEAKREKIISNSLYLNILNCDTHSLISLINETNSYERLINKIRGFLENIEIKEEDLERKKKVLISNELFSFENLEVINEMIIDNIIFDGTVENNMIDLIKSLNKEELDDVLANLDLSNQAIVVLKSKKEQD